MFNYAVEGLLLNVFFIMFPLIFYPFINSDRTEDKPFVKNLFLYVLFASSSVLCLIFHVTVQQGLMFDFRVIPFILACLYSNRIVMLLLFITLLSVRFIYAGQGAYLNLISASLALVLVFFIEKRYHSLRLVHKIIVTSAIAFICKTVGIVSNYIFDPNYRLFDAIIFYIIQSIFMGLTVYIIESIIKNARMRKELIESEKMKIVSVISASVAHEIRNPLTSVRGFIQLLTQADLTAQKKAQYGSICLEELDRAEQIINDYLSLAKPQPENTDKLDIGAELEYVGKVLNSYALLNNVEIIVEFEQDLLIVGDRSKFRQSLINLAKNGIEAMLHQGGQLRITAKRDKDSIVVLIMDNGNGMTNEQIRRLGTPYFSNKEKGTGLGTMVSFNIIKSMTGKIDIRSEVGHGTEFRILFPLHS
ncbi:sensor histidine kinase [Paenibacillus rigui]|uniref:histidine kinase n=1 Tax=Paenibacillus rigui TaxID=554312 RepID=A0A229UX95_9BACL|nr:two-component sensor histidine kinase [Paenibacillus rigui]